MTHDTREVEEILEEFVEKAHYWGYTSGDAIERLKTFLRDALHHQLQKAREEERELSIQVLEEHASNRKQYEGTIISMIDRLKLHYESRRQN